MELTWINKLRIAAVAVLGIVVIGILAWPLVAPADPLMPVRASGVGLSSTLLLLVLAFAIGFAGYFIAWPHGREIGILGVPLGLAVWAGRSGPIRTLTQAWRETAERATLAQSLRSEPLYWMLVVGAGFMGVLLAQRMRPALQAPARDDSSANRRSANVYINGLIALVVAVVIAQFFVGVLAQNLTLPRHVAAQPTVGQILFAVTAGFGVAAFVVKKFLDLSYLLPAAASLFVGTFAQALYYNAETMQRFADTFPATFFPHSLLAIVPIQIVALGTLGSVIGYWMAVRYDYWRKHETT